MDFPSMAILAAEGSIEKKVWANYEQQLFRAVFLCFHGQIFFIFAFNYCSVRAKKLKNISFINIFFEFFLGGSKNATPQDLNPECKSKETLRQALFYLFCAVLSLVEKSVT
jgi:hypothetical protein